MSAKKFRSLTPATALIALAISACATAPDYSAPEIDGIQAAWSVDNPEALRPGGTPKSDWWLDFEDSTLIALIEMAGEQNFDLAQARANLAVAGATVDQARALRGPLGALTSGVTRSKQSSATFGADLPIEFSAQTTYSAGANASWEFDLFGRLSNGVAQAEAALGGQEAVAADISRIVTAQTATTYLTLRELDARIAVNSASLTRQEKVLEITQQLFDAGEVAELDVIRQRNLVETTRAGLSALRSARAQTLSSLALLTGQTVPQLSASFPELADGQAETAAVRFDFSPIDIGEPVDMLRRRPDIRAAERQYAATNFGVGAARADLYPTISLTGSLSTTALEVGDLGSDDSIGYSFGPRLEWGVFNLPFTKARIREAEARAEASRIAFEAAVIGALTETDAALAVYNAGVEEAAIRGRALSDARRALELVEVRYREGADSLISLIDAQRQALAAEDAETQARFEAMRRRVAVYRALGG